MQKLSPSDSLFLDLETPNAHMTIGAINILDPSTAGDDFNLKRDIRSHIEKRLHLSPNLRRKLAFHPLDMEDPRLVDAPDFDLDFHLRFKTLASPNDWSAFTAAVSKIIATPMDKDQPLWEYHILDGLSNIEGVSDKAIGIVTKFHHSVFDGGAAGVTMWQFMQDAPGDTVTPPLTTWQPATEPNMYDWYMSSMFENTKSWWQSMGAMQGVNMGLMSTMYQDKKDPKISPQNSVAPQMRFCQGLDADRTWDSVSLPMNELQQLRLALGKPKMNDLFLTIIAGGMRSYLQKTDELPDEPLLSICPISIREGNPLDGGNFLSAMRVSLFTDIANPIERLIAISKSSSSAKDTVETLGKDFAAYVLASTPYYTRKGIVGMAHADIPITLPLANVTISNAPPPKGGHYFADCKVVTSAGYGPVINNAGITHAVTGMDFESTIGVTSCKKILPDIEFYMQCIRESYKELLTLAGVAKEKPKSAHDKPKKTSRKVKTAKK